MNDFNDIGISRKLDWPRIEHLFRLGLFGALLTLVGDFLLGAAWSIRSDARGAVLFRHLPPVYRARAAACPSLPRRYTRLRHIRRLRFPSAGLCADFSHEARTRGGAFVEIHRILRAAGAHPVLDILPHSRHHADTGLYQGTYAVSQALLGILPADRYGSGDARKCAARQHAVCKRPWLRVDKRG